MTLPPFYRDIKNRRVDTKMAVFALPYNATLLSCSCSCSCSALLPLISGSALPTDFRENVAGPCSNKTNPTLPPAGTGMRQNWHFRPFPLLPGATPSRCWGRAVGGTRARNAPLRRPGCHPDAVQVVGGASKHLISFGMTKRACEHAGGRRGTLARVWPPYGGRGPLLALGFLGMVKRVVS